MAACHELVNPNSIARGARGEGSCYVSYLETTEQSPSRFVSGLFKKCGSNSVAKVFGILFLERPTRERDQVPAREGQAAKTNTCSC